ncbi:odorant receptor 2a-like [Zootermopsis nevadensis]|nr:odorant receptor 2a-like [Zootermopsis nevadensis]XP_021941925.1 odorant receptor 2a-like [Zootermopsis nevadensis]XP_021941926.1 odorant receptor 2a-like [Zootermopsis nevadensis]
MCVNTFSILLSWGNATDTLQALTLIVALTSQLYVYCWFGNELTGQSAELREAVWGCSWVGAPLREQRALLFMMGSANEFTLTAGGIIPASRHTLMQVLNQTYSFLMFLMNFMDD